MNFSQFILCFVLSGFAALLYETVWARHFAVIFGSGELGMAAILAAYRGGLALGARPPDQVITYRQSITDSCLGWDETLRLIERIAQVSREGTRP